FDTVFGPETNNSTVAGKVALPLVAPALRGVNGTIFAYGVTSSGKTHTMLGTDSDPGVVPRVVRELFSQIAAARASGAGTGTSPGPPRDYTVRLSIMEIYNEVLNDLLDPTRTNLKVREDSRSGLVLVDGLLEQVVTTAEQALDLIARGDHNRKVSATAFNEDSSRSHTITRIIVESTPLATGGGVGNDGALIDLAGSESARAVVSKGQRMEGSFINRSLLTLGTVIHKLAAGAAGHVPFRDSKLTRLLQPSLSGPGARVAVVCNITPAAAQSDETANTLKFAARAKLIQ
ncbi:CENPE type kinesin-like protein, partial [Volvox carteri f. nagariensis]